MNDLVCVAPTGDRCGEGVLWHPEKKLVYWTDINRFLIHSFDPANGYVKNWFFDEPATGILLTDQPDVLAVVLGSRLIVWKPETDERTDHLFHLPGWPFVRCNDAAVDPRGSVWIGSMRNNVNADGMNGEAGGTDGVLCRIDPDGNVSEWVKGVGISNTLVWSPDKHSFYFADSLANQVSKYRFDANTGSIELIAPFFSGFGRGAPDGSAMDTEGYLWNCRYGGGCVVRVAPDGSIDKIVEMPTPNVTNCAFGGADFRTLYITTAGSGATDRLAGSLFALRTDVAGSADFRFSTQ